MAAYSVQVAPHTGLAVDKSVAPATTGNTAPTGTGTALLVNNGSGGSINVDVHVPGTVDGLAVATPSGGAAPSRRVAVANGAEALIPLPALYGNASGLATFDLSSATSVTVACVRLA